MFSLFLEVFGRKLEEEKSRVYRRDRGDNEIHRRDIVNIVNFKWCLINLINPSNETWYLVMTHEII